MSAATSNTSRSPSPSHTPGLDSGGTANSAASAASDAADGLPALSETDVTADTSGINGASSVMPLLHSIVDFGSAEGSHEPCR
jgi:hypothetical protein